MNNQPSDTLLWLEANLEEAIEAPDEAFDRVHMLEDSDWALLLDMYDGKPSIWREACAYIFADGPIADSRVILLHALNDSCIDVQTQAAQTICFQLREYPSQTNFSKDNLQKVKQILLSSGNPAQEDIDVLIQWGVS